jgi:hypothetical protein
MSMGEVDGETAFAGGVFLEEEEAFVASADWQASPSSFFLRSLSSLRCWSHFFFSWSCFMRSASILEACANSASCFSLNWRAFSDARVNMVYWNIRFVNVCHFLE